MAKQSGIHQLNGKLRGVSYYRQKGVADGLARTINTGLSKRVKESAAYANTRLNAAEFGQAGSFAGAAIRSISDRQRTMLKDFATGFLAKDVKAIIVNDSTHPWGQRQLSGTGWQEALLAKINTYAKNDFLSFVGGVWDVAVTGEGTNRTWTPNAELAEGWGTMLANLGADGAEVEMYAYLTELQKDGEAAGRGFSKVSLIGKDSVAIGSSLTITEAATVSGDFTGEQGENMMQGVLVVVKPYQTINNENYIRQELCTFSLYPVTVG